MVRRDTLLLAALWVSFGMAVWPQASLGRTWKSKDGQFTTEAELLEANNIRVRLKRSDGKEIDVPLQSLSDQDKRFVESWKKENRTSAAPRKRKDSATSAARSKKSDEPKLAPITVKISDNELTMQAPVGATAEVQGVFPVVRFGERFVMRIEPYSETDLPEFKERFARQSPAFALQKILVQENDALAYTVNAKAFNSTASAYMVVVTVAIRSTLARTRALRTLTENRSTRPRTSSS